MEKYRQDENDQFLALRLGWLRQDMASSSYSVSWTSGWTFLPLVELLECEELYMPWIHYVLPLNRPIPINIQQVYNISYSIHCFDPSGALNIQASISWCPQLLEMATLKELKVFLCDAWQVMLGAAEGCWHVRWGGNRITVFLHSSNWIVDMPIMVLLLAGSDDRIPSPSILLRILT